MFYSITYITSFNYSKFISESVMELRMQPLNDPFQLCLSFELQVNPKSKVLSYRDYMGNTIHHFDIPGYHTQLIITTLSQVETKFQFIDHDKLNSVTWNQIDEISMNDEFLEMMLPSTFAYTTDLLKQFAGELDLSRKENPFKAITDLNFAIYSAFQYEPKITKADSPIDISLELRKGVCQDFAQIMISLVREYLKIPCRYVSGYLYTSKDSNDRSAVDATHAWVEVYFPEIGWMGFDPTNNVIAGDRHIKCAIGRDYMDIPPTRGVFKGDAETELKVSVRINKTDKPVIDAFIIPETKWIKTGNSELSLQQDQQQQ